MVLNIGIIVCPAARWCFLNRGRLADLPPRRLLVDLGLMAIVRKLERLEAQPYRIEQITTAATTPAKSAARAATTAWRIRRIPTAPK